MVVYTNESIDTHIINRNHSDAIEWSDRYLRYRYLRYQQICATRFHTRVLFLCQGM